MLRKILVFKQYRVWRLQRNFVQFLRRSYFEIRISSVSDISNFFFYLFSKILILSEKLLILNFYVRFGLKKEFYFSPKFRLDYCTLVYCLTRKDGIGSKAKSSIKRWAIGQDPVTLWDVCLDKTHYAISAWWLWTNSKFNRKNQRISGQLGMRKGGQIRLKAPPSISQEWR